MKKVLVVDDDPDVGRAMRAKLQGRYAVVVATSGPEALRLAEAGQPDLVLCDVDMPGMDGVTFTEALASREQTKRIPVIFLSALVTPADAERGVSAGARPMLSKNSPLAELMSRIDQALT
jgi:CheY-like chemotaxis protein